MKISQLIQFLEEAMAKHGDVSVEARNPAGDHDEVSEINEIRYPKESRGRGEVYAILIE